MEGREEGKERAALEIARNLKAIGDSVEKIATVTGLSAEEIEKL